MYDAIYPQNLPPGGDAYLGYADGRWPDYQAIAARYGGVPVYALTVFGTDGVGVGVDYEPGDASLAQAAQYIANAVNSGRVDRPIGYCSASLAKGLVDAVTALGVPRTKWRLLTAHYGGGPHICGPATNCFPYNADGTQWSDPGPYDESLVTDDFLRAAAHPGPITEGQFLMALTDQQQTDLYNVVMNLEPFIQAQEGARTDWFVKQYGPSERAGILQGVAPIVETAVKAALATLSLPSVSADAVAAAVKAELAAALAK